MMGCCKSTVHPNEEGGNKKGKFGDEEETDSSGSHKPSPLKETLVPNSSENLQGETLTQLRERQDTGVKEKIRKSEMQDYKEKYTPEEDEYQSKHDAKMSSKYDSNATARSGKKGETSGYKDEYDEYGESYSQQQSNKGGASQKYSSRRTRTTRAQGTNTDSVEYRKGVSTATSFDNDPYSQQGQTEKGSAGSGKYNYSSAAEAGLRSQQVPRYRESCYRMGRMRNNYQRLSYRNPPKYHKGGNWVVELKKVKVSTKKWDEILCKYKTIETYKDVCSLVYYPPGAGGSDQVENNNTSSKHGREISTRASEPQLSTNVTSKDRGSDRQRGESAPPSTSSYKRSSSRQEEDYRESELSFSGDGGGGGSGSSSHSVIGVSGVNGSSGFETSSTSRKN